jgi:hypothetical protein
MIEVLAAKLFAENTMLGTSSVNQAANRFFSLPVSFGDRIKPRLVFVVDQGNITESRQRLLGGHTGNLPQKGKFYDQNSSLRLKRSHLGALSVNFLHYF